MTAVKTNTVSAIDVFFEDDFSLLSEEDNKKLCDTAYDALVKSVNRENMGGVIDLAYMSMISGLSADVLISKLHGSAIVQDPAFFRSEPEWSKMKGWVLLPRYLSGKLLDKLKDAREINRRFPGCFQKNIELIKSKLPAKLSLDEIHVGLGAGWVPEEICELFIKDIFDFKESVLVEYVEKDGKRKITPPAVAKTSVLNNSTFGTLRISGVKIIEKLMNCSTIKVYDEISPNNRIFNEAETVEAQEKEKLIVERFDEWIRETPAVKNILEQKYYEDMASYGCSSYDGNFLELKDLNPEVELFEHQKRAIARIVLSDMNTLLAHDVGAGKTYEMIVAAHELKRLGISNKNLMVIPNNIFPSFVEAHRYLYPNDNILVIETKDFNSDKNFYLEKIRDGDYVAVYMAYSSFDMVVMSKSYWINKMSREIRELRQAAAQKDSKYIRKRLQAKADKLQKKLEEYYDNAKVTPWLNFDELGIETMFVDEAHTRKNIPFSTSSDNVVGMNPKGSEKNKELLEKAHLVKRCVFATATPISNSLADLFAFQLYLQPEMLAFRGLDKFDVWMNTFTKRETMFEIKNDSTDIRPVTRFSKFYNLSELMNMFGCVCDFHYTDEDDSYLPIFRGHTDIIVPRTEAQAKYMEEIAERSEQIHKRNVTPEEDNPLKIAHDSRACAVDVRVLDIPEPESDKGKIAYCAREIVENYHKFPGTSQAVVCDIGTPKAGFNVYDALRSELVALGIPSLEIAYIHDAKTERAKINLFNAVNKAKVRVIIGSTAKLGVGVNIQERLVAMHHLSVPWRPSDLIQIDGRILRRGNTCKEVFIYHYITQGTYDGYSWQRLELKQKFISSFLAGVAAEREAEDVYDTVLSYAERKALAIGDDLIRERVEASNKLERVRMASRQRQKRLIELNELIRTTPAEIRRIKEKISLAGFDKLYYEAHKESVPNDERIAFGEELRTALEGNKNIDKDRYFADYHGFDIYLPANMSAEKPYVFVSRENSGRYTVSMDCDKLMGYSKKLDYFLDHFSTYIENLTKTLEMTEQRLAEAKADYESGNAYYEQADLIRKEIDEIDEKIQKKREEKKNDNTGNQ